MSRAHFAKKNHFEAVNMSLAAVYNIKKALNTLDTILRKSGSVGDKKNMMKILSIPSKR